MTHTPELERLYTFAVCMLGAREEAFAAVHDVTAQYPDEDRRLRALVAPFIAARRAPRLDRFAELDDILRTHSTIPVDLSHPLVRGDARRLNVLLAELQRSCLTATLRGIAPERRAVFILRHMLGLSVERCAEVCGITANACVVADTRARRDLENYLGVRCEHMDARNSCRCAGRLGNALEQGLVDWPHAEHDLSLPSARRTFSRASDLYANLPRVRLPVLP